MGRRGARGLVLEAIDEPKPDSSGPRSSRSWREILGVADVALARGIATAFGSRAAGAVVGLGVQVLLARMVGVDQYGLYVYVLAWVHLGSAIGKLGINTAVLRYVPAYESQRQWGLLRGFLRRSPQLPVATAAVLAVVMAAVVWTLQPRLGAAAAMVFWAGCIVVPLEVVLETQVATLLAMRAVVASHVTHGIIRPITVVVGTWIVLQTRPPAALVPVIMEIAGIVAALTLGTYALRHVMPPPVATAIAQYRTVEWWVASVRFSFISQLQMVMSQTDTLLLGWLRGTSAVGVYAAASRLARVVLFGLDAANAIVAPAISRLHAGASHAELQRTVTRSARGILVLTVPVILALVLFGRAALRMFGPEFVDGHAILMVLLGGQIINALSGSVGFLLSMTGHEAVLLRLTALIAGSNLVLNIVLISGLGAIGAAIATATSTALRNLILGVTVWRRLRIRSTPL